MNISSALSMWAVSFLGETVADWQKLIFRMDPRNEDKFISHGLWKYSRHPNYFFEITAWISLTMFCQPYLQDWWQLGKGFIRISTVPTKHLSFFPVLQHR